MFIFYFIACVNAGIGCSTLTKILVGVNMPGMPSPLYKRHEREAGPVIEEVAKDSCLKAAL